MNSFETLLVAFFISFCLVSETICEIRGNVAGTDDVTSKVSVPSMAIFRSEKDVLSTISLKFTSIEVKPVSSVSDGDGDTTTRHSVVIPGCATRDEFGEPMLPMYRKKFSIPKGYSVSIENVDWQDVSIGRFDVALGSGPTVDSLEFRSKNKSPNEFSRIKNVVNQLKLKKNVRFSRDNVELVFQSWRDENVVFLLVFPCSATLIGDEISDFMDVSCVSSVNITLSGELSENFDTRPLSTRGTVSDASHDDYPENLWSKTILEDISGVKTIPSGQRPSEIYMILYNEQYSTNAKLLEFVEWKRLRGYNVKMVSTASLGPYKFVLDAVSSGVADGDFVAGVTPIDIQCFLRLLPVEEYPTYLLLIGDVPTSRGVPAVYYLNGHGGFSDFEFSRINENDMHMDLYVGRLPVTSNAELSSTLEKVLSMQKTISQISSSVWGKVHSLGMPELGSGNELDRWFLETLDATSSYFSDRMNGGSVTRWWESDGCTSATTFRNGYVWKSYNSLGTRLSGLFSSAPSQQTIQNAFQSSTLLYYRNHGGVGGWAHPRFDSDYALATANKQSSSTGYPLVLSITCLTGSYMNTWYGRPSMIAALLRSNRGGASASIAATDLSYSPYNDQLYHGFMLGKFPDYSDFVYNSPIDYNVGDFIYFDKSNMGKQQRLATLWKRMWDSFFDMKPSGHYREQYSIGMFGDPDQFVHIEAPFANNPVVPSTISRFASSMAISSIALPPSGATADIRVVSLICPSLGIHRVVKVSAASTTFVLLDLSDGALLTATDIDSCSIAVTGPLIVEFYQSISISNTLSSILSIVRSTCDNPTEIEFSTTTTTPFPMFSLVGHRKHDDDSILGRWFHAQVPVDAMGGHDVVVALVPNAKTSSNASTASYWNPEITVYVGDSCSSLVDISLAKDGGSISSSSETKGVQFRIPSIAPGSNVWIFVSSLENFAGEFDITVRYASKCIACSSGSLLSSSLNSPHVSNRGALLGQSISVCSINSKVAVGAPGLEKVYIFDSSYSSAANLSTSAPVATLDSPLSSSGRFGHSVDWSDDGKSLIVGVPGHRAVFLYYSSNGKIWSDTSPLRLILPTSAPTGFGAHVRISNDGSVTAVAAPGSSGSGTEEGRVYVYRGDPSTSSASSGYPQEWGWGPTSINYPEYFGYSMDMSKDGTVIVIGHPNGDTDDGQAIATVFDSGSSSWITVTLVSNGGSCEQCGKAVTVSPSAEWIAVSCPFERSSHGKVIVFRRGASPTSYSQYSVFSSYEGGTYYGSSLKFSDTDLYISQRLVLGLGNGVGDYHSYGSRSRILRRKIAEGWSTKQILRPIFDPSFSSNYFGVAMGIDTTASRIWVGAPLQANPYEISSGLVRCGAVASYNIIDDSGSLGACNKVNLEGEWCVMESVVEADVEYFDVSSSVPVVVSSSSSLYSPPPPQFNSSSSSSRTLPTTSDSTIPYTSSSGNSLSSKLIAILVTTSALLL